MGTLARCSTPFSLLWQTCLSLLSFLACSIIVKIHVFRFYVFFIIIFFGVYVQVHEETYTDWNEKLEISKFHFLHLICYRNHRVTLLFLTNKHKLLRINAKQQKFPTSTQILLKQKSFSPSKNLIKKLLGIISICLYLFISLPGRMRTKM